MIRAWYLGGDVFPVTSILGAFVRGFFLRASTLVATGIGGLFMPMAGSGIPEPQDPPGEPVPPEVPPPDVPPGIDDPPPDGIPQPEHEPPVMPTPTAQVIHLRHSGS